MEEQLGDPVSDHLDNKILFDPHLRVKLVNNVFDFVQKNKFNGIELLSAYLIEDNADASDKQNFVLLLKALKEKFDKKGLILSLAVDFRESTAKKFDIKEISKYVSFINLRTYDFHGGIYENKRVVRAGHIAPLYHSSKENTEDRKLNVDFVVKLWISEGAPPSKLILGTTFNGISYTLTDPKQIGRNAPVDGPILPYILPTITYHDVCRKEKDRVWKQLYDKEQQVSYLYNGKEMISYDGADSIKRKAEYAKKLKLGGVFVDSLDKDDFSGKCGREKYPLLRIVNRVLRDKC
ncbi:probable chitinase 10 [Belonocnema kinseyi]|uniref:probable chitinase 10 n=1 Tax=Belonocnema kinseyi TaxID=2817044 RepID=UPI00143CF826|nr:probable chitinase 10 [Belonocnema kinseyi]